MIAIIIIIFREQLIFTPIRTITGKILFNEEDDDEVASVFNSVASLNIQIKKYREDLKQEEEILKEKIDELSQFYTVPNLLQQLAKTAYDSVITTSNIAKITYFIVQKFKRKKKPKQIEE